MVHFHFQRYLSNTLPPLNSYSLRNHRTPSRFLETSLLCERRWEHAEFLNLLPQPYSECLLVKCSSDRMARATFASYIGDAIMRTALWQAGVTECPRPDLCAARASHSSLECFQYSLSSFYQPVMSGKALQVNFLTISGLEALNSHIRSNKCKFW